jgi:hypothetical protein
MPYPKKYSKDLTHLTTVRLSPSLRNDGERCAEYLGISFSDFIRQSLNRNIRVSMSIEEEVNKQTSSRAMGRVI